VIADKCIPRISWKAHMRKINKREQINKALKEKITQLYLDDQRTPNTSLDQRPL